MYKVPKIFEMQTIQLTENGLKQGKNTSWTFHRCKSIKIFNLPYGHWINFIQILLLFKNYAYLITIQVRKLIPKSFMCLTYYIYFILAAQKFYAQHLLYFLPYIRVFQIVVRGWGVKGESEILLGEIFTGWWEREED